MPGTRLRSVRADGTPVYRYEPRRGMPPISVIRFDPVHDPIELPSDHRHTHDFLVLVFVERGDLPVRIDNSAESMPTGAVYPISPGQVLGAGSVTAIGHSLAWAVFFMPEAVPGTAGFSSPLRWGDHPLLALFTPARSPSQPPRRLVVPPAERPGWSERFAELHAETSAPDQVGADQAAAAALTLILVDAARLARTQGQTTPSDPLVARVFAVIEDHYQDPISTRDVARELGYTTGHLTTVIRERTGRTILDWLTERRLTEARRLLAETDLSLRAIAAATGHRDAEYLTRRFRGHYGMPPLRWRRLSRTR
ncbi:MAG TPA: AraC family transcriptional regulator [Microlunatus sp.]